MQALSLNKLSAAARAFLCPSIHLRILVDFFAAIIMMGRDCQVASEHRVAAIVTQQVMAAMSDQPASLASPKRFGVLPAIESPARAYKGPLLPTEDSPRVDVLDRKVDKLTEDVGKLTEEIGGIKILLKKLAGER